MLFLFCAFLFLRGKIYLTFVFYLTLAARIGPNVYEYNLVEVGLNYFEEQQLKHWL